MSDHSEAHAAHIVPNAVFYKVWISLLILTGITAGASILFPGPVGLSVAFIVTPLKAGLVLAFFMHLRYESKLYQYMFYSAILILVVFLALTYMDYLTR